MEEDDGRTTRQLFMNNSRGVLSVTRALSSMTSIDILHSLIGANSQLPYLLQCSKHNIGVWFYVIFATVVVYCVTSSILTNTVISGTATDRLA